MLEDAKSGDGSGHRLVSWRRRPAVVVVGRAPPYKATRPRSTEDAPPCIAGIDPGVLAWLLSRFPVAPLPTMLEPLEAGELSRYRDQLAERLKEA